jgi:hypothetical protein
MKKSGWSIGAAFTAALIFICANGSAHATTLLDLIDPPTQTDTQYSLAFNATATSTTISIGGYQAPSEEIAYNIGVFLNNAGADLLGSTWSFVPAASGSDSFAAGTLLAFLGTTPGFYDTYSQTFATTVGSSYSLDFLFSNNTGIAAPSGLLVTTDAVTAVPEPSTWAMLLLGFAGLGFMAYRRKNKPTFRFA